MALRWIEGVSELAKMEIKRREREDYDAKWARYNAERDRDRLASALVKAGQHQGMIQALADAIAKAAPEQRAAHLEAVIVQLRAAVNERP